MSEWEVRGLWEASIDALIVTHDPDYARTNLRQTLEKAIGVFEKVAAAGGAPTAPPPTAPIPPSPEQRTAPPDYFSFSCPNCSRRVTAPLRRWEDREVPRMWSEIQDTRCRDRPRRNGRLARTADTGR